MQAWSSEWSTPPYLQRRWPRSETRNKKQPKKTVERTGENTSLKAQVYGLYNEGHRLHEAYSNAPQRFGDNTRCLVKFVNRNITKSGLHLDTVFSAVLHIY